ncbi:carbohydrate kinase family protein [Candidatus Uhrbacteria bacterium]|nr:carbohydrate kinase family protein [Candidatus Uhrbacteria bacterium]
MIYDVVTIGAATRDVFLVSDAFQVFKSKRFSTGLGECVALGSKVDVQKIFLSSGGGATNAAVTFSRLGFKTACVARVGEDTVGRDVTDELAAYGIETKHLIRVANEPTAYSTLLTTNDGERTVLVFRGASKTFTPKDIDGDIFKKTRWVYLTSLGGNITLGKRIIDACRKAGVHVAWNPGAQEIRESAKDIRELLKRDVSVFNVNREEAAALTGAPRENILKLFEGLSPENHRVRIITDGENGAYLCNGGSCYHSGTSGKPSISRTGAGDAFGSGVVACLMMEHGIYTALQVGTLNAESVIQSLGAKQGILKKFPSNKLLATIPVTTL